MNLNRLPQGDAHPISPGKPLLRIRSPATSRQLDLSGGRGVVIGGGRGCFCRRPVVLEGDGCIGIRLSRDRLVGEGRGIRLGQCPARGDRRIRHRLEAGDLHERGPLAAPREASTPGDHGLGVELGEQLSLGAIARHDERRTTRVAHTLERDVEHRARGSGDGPRDDDVEPEVARRRRGRGGIGVGGALRRRRRGCRSHPRSRGCAVRSPICRTRASRARSRWTRRGVAGLPPRSRVAAEVLVGDVAREVAAGVHEGHHELFGRVAVDRALHDAANRRRLAAARVAEHEEVDRGRRG